MRRKRRRSEGEVIGGGRLREVDRNGFAGLGLSDEECG